MMHVTVDKDEIDEEAIEKFRERMRNVRGGEWWVKE